MASGVLPCLTANGFATIVPRGRRPGSLAQAWREWLDDFNQSYPTVEWGLRCLERRAAPEHVRPVELVLCHGDFRTGNFLVHGGSLVALLDWAFAGWGDRLEDIVAAAHKLMRPRRSNMTSPFRFIAGFK